MGILFSIARKFNEYTIKYQQRYVLSNKAYEVSKLRVLSTGCSSNSITYEVSKLRMLALNSIVPGLTDPDINLIGVCGSDYAERSTLMETVSRIVKRDNLFDVVVMKTLKDKPDLKRIQEELSQMLGLTFDKKKDVVERARCLCDKIKEQHKILIILHDIWKRLDLGKVGIPIGADHPGCKILLTSRSEEFLSNQMHTQKNFSV